MKKKKKIIQKTMTIKNLKEVNDPENDQRKIMIKKKLVLNDAFKEEKNDEKKKTVRGFRKSFRRN